VAGAAIGYNWAVVQLATGDVVAGYRVENVVARGGMGVVYRATDLSLDRVVALKLIAIEHADDPAFRRRYTTESKTAASLDHPNVIPIFAAGEHEGSLFLVMRYVEGRNLAAEIEANGALPLDRAVSVVAQVAAALDAAHAASLVHRDVTPANILLTASDHVYLMDFGLTKRRLADADETQTGHLMGTLNYVAPEQIRGAEIDHRTDIYALGCVAFHAMTGRVPFPIKEQEAKLWAHVSEPPPLVSSVAAGVPAEVDGVITRAMAKDPADRFESAGAMAAGLAAAAGGAARMPNHHDVPLPTVTMIFERLAESDRRTLIIAAAIAPFSIAVLAGTLIAATAFGLMPLGVAAALVSYAAAIAVTIRDADFRARHTRR
jgi:serine/threonine-protein kinase